MIAFLKALWNGCLKALEEEQLWRDDIWGRAAEGDEVAGRMRDLIIWMDCEQERRRQLWMM